MKQNPTWENEKQFVFNTNANQFNKLQHSEISDLAQS